MSEELQTSKLNNRLTLLGLFLIFVIPLVFAYWAYYAGFFEGKQGINKGELLQPLGKMQEFAFYDVDGNPVEQEKFRKKWLLIYVNGEDECGEVCKLTLETLDRVHLGLHKDAIDRNDGHDRVIGLLIQKKGNSAVDKIENLFVTIANNQIKPIDQQTQSIQTASIYIVDPLGWVVMRYDHFTTVEQALEKAKNIIYDFKKLLKFSRVG